MGKKKSKDEPVAREEELPEAEVVDPLTAAEQERDEYLVNWQRARADFQNLKRRTLEDIEAAVARERSSLLEETLTILDYLDMALASQCESQDAQNLLVGVRMTRDQLWAMLERQQVKAIDADGAFDPNLHQAVSTVETEDAEPGSVVEIVRRGYTIGDRVLRYAQVKVAAAPDSKIEQSPPPPAEEEATEDA